MNWIKRIEMAIKGKTFIIVKIISVLTDKWSPFMFIRQKIIMIKISINKRKLMSYKPKEKIYCPIPDAIVEIPNIEDTMYRITKKIDICLPNTFENK